MEGQLAYQTFAALKLHFTSKYDYFLYNGKTRQSKNFDANKFAMRRDYFHYKKIERRYKDELINFIVANMICGKTKWVGDLITLESDKTYREWKKRQEAMKYFMRLDMSNIQEDPKTLWTIVDGNHPPFLKLYLGKKISLETLIIANEVLGFVDNWNQTIRDKIIWPDVSRLMMKYKAFLKIDTSEMKHIMRETLMT